MAFVYYAIILCLTGITIPLYNSERDRYMKAFDVCLTEYKRNEFTLSQPVCRNIQEREQCSVEMREACIKAEYENAYTPEMCARTKWFEESAWVSAYRVVATFASTTWILLVLCISVIVVIPYYYFQHKTAEKRDRIYIEGMEKMFHRTANTWDRYRIKGRSPSPD